MKWKLVDNDAVHSSWNKNLQTFEDYNFYQSFQWGEYKKSFAWDPQRWVALDDNNKIISMLQGLFRVLPLKIGIFWIPGGPIGDIKTLNDHFFSAVSKTMGLRNLYYRFSSYKTCNSLNISYLERIGWKHSSLKVGAESSLVIDLSISEKNLLANCSKNWRRNLKRAERYEHYISHCSKYDFEELTSVYKSMLSFKNISKVYNTIEWEEFFTYFKENIILLKYVNDKGKIVAFRGCVILGNKGWDFWAASSSEGRKLYASNILLWTLLLQCRLRNILFYDLGGVDTSNNRGVFNFKKGTGASEVKYLGEWECASSKRLMQAINIAIGLRKRFYR